MVYSNFHITFHEQGIFHIKCLGQLIRFMKKVTWVTSNEGKLRELKAILGTIGVELVHRGIDLPELQLFTSEEVAVYKAKEAASVCGPCLVDDTALHFNALNGLPGAYIKAFTSKMTPENISKLLDSFEDKSAYVTCSIGYCEPGKEPMVFTGRVDGKIVPPRGSGGFGFDPIFQPNGYDQTYAELSAEQKNTCSHRYLALMKLKESGILDA
ncbi:Inosine triphosphate pyrophosphatase [Tritrichomonas foetus]|uniref:XTP/dITP diphosphatase n=1 Tax=Tritrichomonas foetus TaxID=1144522 RepID=A0A1J4JGM3_9EUKA|nr:Inosine triphosphate pyrophosphatase [Tritrichomonas foetus]|eukprot:OHS96605.1 Inosine triphosphate pyrophosphatase [Tritrichomonas foetus]